jgi:hypothetical protein
MGDAPSIVFECVCVCMAEPNHERYLLVIFYLVCAISALIPHDSIRRWEWGMEVVKAYWQSGLTVVCAVPRT